MIDGHNLWWAKLNAELEHMGERLTELQTLRDRIIEELESDPADWWKDQ